MLKALVISPNEKTTEHGSLLAIARTEARKREHSTANPPIRALRFLSEVGIYIAIYEVTEKNKEEDSNVNVKEKP